MHIGHQEPLGDLIHVAGVWGRPIPVTAYDSVCNFLRTLVFRRKVPVEQGMISSCCRLVVRFITGGKEVFYRNDLVRDHEV